MSGWDRIHMRIQMNLVLHAARVCEPWSNCAIFLSSLQMCLTTGLTMFPIILKQLV